jgi:hypothetical protein
VKRNARAGVEDRWHRGPKLRVQLDRVDEAVRSVVPQSMWAEILAKLKELEPHPETLDIGEDAFDDDDAPFDPTEFIDDDDDEF